MKKTSMLLLSLGFAAVLILAPQALAQQESQQPAIVEGALLEVDANAQTIMVASSGQEQPMTFAYSEDTEVVGSIENVQGLNGQAGAQLRVTYQVRGESNVATTIEVINLPEKEL